MRKHRHSSWTLILALALSSVFIGSDELAGSSKLVVPVTYVKQVPAGLDDVLWQKAAAAQVPFEGKERFKGQKLTLTTLALHTDDSIYFLFKWNDPTKSVTKGAWQFDGQQWSQIKSDEDRIALLFEINRIDKFATKGCAVTCHGPAGAPTKDFKFGTQAATEKGDLWHWKAARSDPYNYADDGWLTAVSDKTGRTEDIGQGGDVRNETPDKSKPLYMQDPARKPSAPGFLLMEEAVKISDYSNFKAGDVIPYRLPKKPAGSRFDIKALSRYANDGWTVMLWRKLDTGHEDDVAFNPRKEYGFAIAIFDDSGDEHSYDSEVMTLQFGR